MSNVWMFCDNMRQLFRTVKGGAKDPMNAPQDKGGHALRPEKKLRQSLRLFITYECYRDFGERRIVRVEALAQSIEPFGIHMFYRRRRASNTV
jgi:hypothetical protein